MSEFTLDKNLKYLLEEHGLSVPKLSAMSDVPTKTIHNWLVKQKPRNISQVKQIATFFNLTVDELCFGEETSGTVIDQYKDEINAGIYEVILRPIKK